MNVSLIARVYNVSRGSILRWDGEGRLLDKLATLGIACYPSRIERVSSSIDPSIFDDLSVMPPRPLDDNQKEWLRIAYSVPGGPIIDPRPRVGAAKGVYYDEKRGQWFARPYQVIPG